MAKGDLILIPFPFTDLSGKKLRPALVLYESNSDVTLCFVTTQLQWQEPTDLIVQPDSENGIKKISLIRLSKIATVDRKLAIGKIGRLNSSLIAELNQKLMVLLQIP